MSDTRKRLIKLIHVAKRDLKLDDDTYRHILMQIGNANSAANLNVSNLQKVLDHLKACGFRIRPKKKFTRSMAQDPQSKKIRALWLFLHELNTVRDPSERALAMYVKRLTKVDALQWLDDKQTVLVIETLKKWVMRVLPNKIQTLKADVLMLSLPNKNRKEVKQITSLHTYDDDLCTWKFLQKLFNDYKEIKS